MDSNTEDRMGTVIKVNQFILDNAAVLAVNAQIEAQRVILNADGENVFQNDSTATRDITGFTEMKGDARTALENMVLLVRAGCTGYYTLNSNPGKLGIINFADSKVTRARDNDLYVLADQVYDVALPIKALMAAFQVTGANVDAILTLKDAYKTAIPLPRSEEGINVAAGEERDRLVDVCFNTTLPKIDAYMLPFKYTYTVLYSKYETARAIDNSGGGSDSAGYDVSNYPLAPGETVSFGAAPAADTHIYLRQIGGTVGIIVCANAAAGNPCAAGYTLTPATTVKSLYGDLGLGADPEVNFTNTGDATVTVRAGLKT